MMVKTIVLRAEIFNIVDKPIPGIARLSSHTLACRHYLGKFYAVAIAVTDQ